MQLSPLNFTGLLHRDVFDYSHEKPDTMPGEKRRRAEVVTMYRCPDCGETHDWEEDAEDCCQGPDPELELSPYARTCPVCGEKAEDAYDASDCCLWKDIDKASRHEIARQVEAGSTWAQALGVWPPKVL